MKKIMFFDIDGTLLDFGAKTLTPKMKWSLKQLRNNKIKIGLSTGRQTAVYEDLFKEFITFDFVIGSNGREVIIDDKLVYQQTFSEDLLRKLIAYDDTYHLGLMLASNNHRVCTSDATDKCINYLHNLNLDAPHVDRFYPFEHPILQGMIYCDEQQQQVFEDNFPELTCVRHKNDGIDIITKGPMKENGVAIVLEHFGLKQQEALAFGDGLNDLGMFQYIDGICLGHAHPELVTISQAQIGMVHEDGIYHYLVENGYIEEMK